MLRVSMMVLLLSMIVVACKQAAPPPPPPQAAAPKTATPAPAPQAQPVVQDSVADVIATFIHAMQEGNEKKAKSVLALEYFDNYSLPYAVEIKQYTITERTVLDTAEIVRLAFVDPPHVGDVRVRTEQYMAGNELVYGTYWLRKINGYWRIWGWGLS
jgi:uncharacterized protein (DUF885 family)